MIKGVALVGALVAVMSVGACNMQDMVAAPNPAFQSQESRDIRAWFNGATIQSVATINDTSSVGLQRVEFTTRYSSNGSFSKVSRFIHRDSAQDFQNVVDGNWNIRDNQMCERPISVDGRRVPGAAQQLQCMIVVLQGEAAQITAVDTGRTATIRRSTTGG